MRDLRYSVRQLTEPIKIINITTVVNNGIVDDGVPTEKEAYANVMLNLKTNNNNNSTNVASDSIKIEILDDQDLEITPEITNVVVRGKKYVVVSSNPFNINAQTIILTANAIK